MMKYNRLLSMLLICTIMLISSSSFSLYEMRSSERLISTNMEQQHIASDDEYPPFIKILTVKC